MKHCPICNEPLPKKWFGLFTSKHCQNISCSDYYANNMGMDGVENFSRLKGDKKKPGLKVNTEVADISWLYKKKNNLLHFDKSENHNLGLSLPKANKG